MRVFVDNDVILDVLLERKNFSYSAKIIEYIEKKTLEGFTSAIIFTNTFFLIAKARNKDTAWNSLRKLRLLFRIADMDEKIVDSALTSGFKDFEDSLQYYSAIGAKAKYLITRNKEDYKGEEVTIVSPQEFIGLFEKN